jgi:hypothetical protein
MKIQQVQLLNYGILVAEAEERVREASSPTGYFLYPERIRFIEQADTFIGKPGLKFGISYRIEGFDKTTAFEVAPFFCRIYHPWLMNPVTKKRFCETVEEKTGYLNQEHFDYYSFDFDWEVQKGVWAFQVVELGHVLAEKSFTIK